MIQENELNELEYNQDNGVFNTQDIKKTPKKWVIGGKMGYIGSIDKLLDLLSKKEMKFILDWFANHSNGNNLLTSTFTKLTSNMNRSSRSRFKKKLSDNMIIQEYRGQIMLNPFIFKPTSTSHNYAHLTQQLWKYLFMDKDTGSDEVRFHEDDVYGLKLK